MIIIIIKKLVNLSREIFAFCVNSSSANWLPKDFSRGLIFVNLTFINVLYILIFSWFVLQLVVCESRCCYANISIFQIALFGYKRLNSWLNVLGEIKRSRYSKKIYIFLSMLSLLIYCLISCKIFLTWPFLIDRETNVKM